MMFVIWTPLFISLRLFRGLSLRALVLIGFALAILPLLMGIVSAVTSVEDLSVMSQKTVYQVAQQARSSRILVEKLTELERRGKQYLILEDEPARLAYEDSHSQFVELLDGLRQLAGPSELTNTLSQLEADEKSIYETVLQVESTLQDDAGKGARPKKASSAGFNQERMRQTTAAFQELNAKARLAAKEYSDFVDSEANELTEHSKEVQRRMLAQTSVLLPVSVMLIVIFIYLIIRPIRQLDHAIRALGFGNFRKPIKVMGSRDLEFLGERLEWLRTRLNDLEEVKQRFMRNVSHEIKTPLANLREGTELLADEVVGKLSQEQREIAQILISNTHKLESLIANLINYSQANARPDESKLENVDIRALVLDIIEDYQLRLRAKNVMVKAEIGPVSLHGSREQLKTIVDNLMSNAVKYSPTGGEIRVRLREAGGHMELEVEDDGPGIDPNERSHVFEPFFQGRASREYGVAGTGLGLAIVGECVASHHGKVEALEPRNHGARIRVQLPIDVQAIERMKMLFAARERKPN